MSGFEDNPFGEPIVDNPFADPAVQNVARSATATNVLEDYDPFGEDKSRPPAIENKQLPQTFPAYNQGPPITPAYGAPSSQISTDELQRRQEELDRKERELKLREEQLRNSGTSVRLNNWPPLPENFCFKPCFYHDIDVEIAPEFQRIVRRLYYLWVFYALILMCNIIVGLLLMFHGGEHRFGQFTLGLIYGTLFTPASLLCWYRPVYKAFRSDSSFNFMIFFMIFFFQLFMLVYQAVGIPGSGYCGFFTALSLFDSTFVGIILGLLCMTIAISFTMCAVGNFLLLTQVHKIYRSSNMSMEKARMEFTSEVMRNKNVQNVASQAAQSAINSQFKAKNADRY